MNGNLCCLRFLCIMFFIFSILLFYLFEEVFVYGRVGGLIVYIFLIYNCRVFIYIKRYRLVGSLLEIEDLVRYLIYSLLFKFDDVYYVIFTVN